MPVRMVASRCALNPSLCSPIRVSDERIARVTLIRARSAADDATGHDPQSQAAASSWVRASDSAWRRAARSGSCHASAWADPVAGREAVPVGGLRLGVEERTRILRSADVGHGWIHDAVVARVGRRLEPDELEGVDVASRGLEKWARWRIPLASRTRNGRRQTPRSSSRPRAGTSPTRSIDGVGGSAPWSGVWSRSATAGDLLGERHPERRRRIASGPIEGSRPWPDRHRAPESQSMARSCWQWAVHGRAPIRSLARSRRSSVAPHHPAGRGSSRAGRDIDRPRPRSPPHGRSRAVRRTARAGRTASPPLRRPQAGRRPRRRCRSRTATHCRGRTSGTRPRHVVEDIAGLRVTPDIDQETGQAPRGGAGTTESRRRTLVRLPAPRRPDPARGGAGTAASGRRIRRRARMASGAWKASAG